MNKTKPTDPIPEWDIKELPLDSHGLRPDDTFYGIESIPSTLYTQSEATTAFSDFSLGSKKKATFRQLKMVSLLSGRIYGRTLASDPNLNQAMLGYLVYEGLSTEQLTDHAVRCLAEEFRTELTDLNLSWSSSLTGAALESPARCCTGLKELDLSGCMGIDDGSIQKLLTNCRELTGLSLDRCSQVLSSSIQVMARSCTKLQVLNIRGCSQILGGALVQLFQACQYLEELNLANCHQLENSDFEKLTKHATNLRRLDLSRCVQLEDPALLSLARRCQKLERLRVYHCENISQEGFSKLAEGCRLLVELDASHCPGFGDNALQKLAKHCPNIQVLLLSGCNRLSTKGLIKHMSKCLALEELKLSGCQAVTDKFVGKIATSLKKLTFLDLAGCHEITEATVDSLANRESPLVEVDLTKCALISRIAVNKLKETHPGLLVAYNEVLSNLERAELQAKRSGKSLKPKRRSVTELSLSGSFSNSIDESTGSQISVHELSSTAETLSIVSVAERPRRRSIGGLFDSSFSETQSSKGKEDVDHVITQAEREVMVFKELLRNIKSGDAEDHFQIGLCYARGEGTDVDYTKAGKYFEKAIKMGSVPAKVELGILFEQGLGGRKVDLKKACDLYLEAVLADDPSGYAHYGRCLEQGIHVDMDLDQAEKNYQFAANKRDPEGQYRLGRLYELDDTSEGLKQAVTFYLEAGNQGHAEANNRLGSLNFSKKFPGAKISEAIYRFQKAAARKLPDAMYNLAVCYHSHYATIEAPDQKALELFKEAADLGHVKAAYNVGCAYLFGEGCESSEKNHKLAVKYFEIAAQKGLSEAVYNLAVCHEYGQGVEKRDLKVAIELYEEAARLGHPGAKRVLGRFYEHGIGVAHNAEKAVTLYTEAANAGLAEADYSLGCCYLRGEGVDKADPKQAARCFRRAAEKKYAPAEYQLALLVEAGVGRPKPDPQRAFRLLTRAAEHSEYKHPDTLFKLAGYYERGDVVKRDVEKAAEFYAQAAEAGHAEAALWTPNLKTRGAPSPLPKGKELIKSKASSSSQSPQFSPKTDEKVPTRYCQALVNLARDGSLEARYQLGLCYLLGRNIKPNGQLAAAELRKAAGGGHPGAQYELGICFVTGAGVVQSRDEGHRLIKLAAEQGHTKALLWISKTGKPELKLEPKNPIPHVGKGKEEAVSVKDQRHQADMEAEYQAGLAYHEVEDFDKALEYFMIAASQGHPGGLFGAGFLLFLKGEKDKGSEFILMAADKGNSAAIKTIGELYERRGHMDRAIKWRRKFADRGDVKSQFWLGCLLLDGKCVLDGLVDGRYYLDKAAAQGHRGAIKRLSKLEISSGKRSFIAGPQGKFDVSSIDLRCEQAMLALSGERNAGGRIKAVALLRAAARDESPHAHLMRHILLDRPLSLTDKQLANVCAELKKMKESEPAQILYGLCLCKGVGVKRDGPRGGDILKDYIHGPYRGLVMSELGKLLRRLMGMLKDPGKAYLRYFKEAAKYGVPDSQFHLAISEKEISDRDKIKLLEAAAKQDHPQAQYEWTRIELEKIPHLLQWPKIKGEESPKALVDNLPLLNDTAVAIFSGHGVKKDLARAARFLRYGATHRHLPSVFNLALCYEFGWGVPKDREEAAILYELVAEKGHAEAQLRLGTLCYLGLDIDKNYKRAFELFSSAVENGEPRALYPLACCYVNGYGVAKDVDKGNQFMSRAVEEEPSMDALNYLCYGAEPKIFVDDKRKPVASSFFES